MGPSKKRRAEGQNMSGPGLSGKSCASCLHLWFWALWLELVSWLAVAVAVAG